MSEPMDLRPRTDLDDAEAIRRDLKAGQRRWVMIVGAVVVVAIGFVVVQFLRDATLFFRNVDEAIEQRVDLDDRRFRLQGRVIPDSVVSDGDVVTFQVMHNCAVAGVRHLSDPPELFSNPWIPVVLEGSWQPGPVSVVTGQDDHVFVSDRMLIKHTNEYSSENLDRVDLNLPTDFFDECEVTPAEVGVDR